MDPPQVMSKPALAEIIYAISNISFRHEYRPPSLPSSSPKMQLNLLPKRQKSHLELLNLLAVLLVTEASHDVAAVSLHRTVDNKITLCYAKNRPLSLEETFYVINLLAISTNPNTTIKEKKVALLTIVVKTCWKKILSRVQAIRKRLESLGRDSAFKRANQDCVDPVVVGSPMGLSYDRYIRDLVGDEMFPITASLKDFLANWLHSLSKLFPKGTPFRYTNPASFDLLLKTTNVCYYLVRNPQTESILEQKLLILIGKIADYRLATSLLLREMLQLETLELFSLRIFEVS